MSDNSRVYWKCTEELERREAGAAVLEEVKRLAGEGDAFAHLFVVLGD